ncbi:MAG: hypothetical protein DI565_01575 [Ancylobacter novellus]|uniref:Signal transduction histidine kinase subgroup 2 dimerisation and phosphoacceptor domain-containing protein n=1 Tax=Ancylobacter novellus TaxID=921 RepID=A0A2W5KPU5_ANCNO|nr:MAG: hypothetical protein DI565_01575 [Ancylobacter novellus]
MKTDLHPPLRDDVDGETTTVAAVRHLFRNQIQMMTSLVGLFGRRLPDGEGRDAFADLRARFDAVTFGPPDDVAPDASGRMEVDLAELARRISRHLDPDFRHRVAVKGAPILATPKRAAAVAQIIAELIIELTRRGFVGHESGSAEISIEQAADGSIAIRLVQTGPAGVTPRRDPSDLGATIADSLVRSLDGRIDRAASGPLTTDVFMPPEPTAR